MTMNDTALFMIFFMVMTFTALGCLSFSEQEKKNEYYYPKKK